MSFNIEECPRDERGHIHVGVADKCYIMPPYRIVGTAGAGQTLEFLVCKTRDGARLGQETGVTGKDIVPVPTHNQIITGQNRPGVE